MGEFGRMQPDEGRGQLGGPKVSRRWAIGGSARVAVAVLASGAALGRARDGGASIVWCRTDPIITVNGRTFHVYVLSTEAMYRQATGPTEIIVKYPQGTSASGQLVPGDNGFGRGYNLNLQPTSGLQASGGSFQIKVAVRVGANDSSLPVRMEAVRSSDGRLLAAKQAYANNWFESSAFWI
jgi:hypothetical protein